MDRQRKLILLYLLYLRRKRHRQRKKRRMHPLNQERGALGMFETLFEKLRQDDLKFSNYFQMTKSSFDQLLEQLKNSRKYRNKRCNISCRKTGSYVKIFSNWK